MKLEEAKEILKSMLNYMENDETESEAIETVLQELDNSISKDKITNFIKKELPDDEICTMCDVYDVNGIEVKNKLQELLEDKQC